MTIKMNLQRRTAVFQPSRSPAGSRSRVLLILLGTLGVFGAAEVRAEASKPLPQRLSCGLETAQSYALSLGEDASPVAFSAVTVSGSRECELHSQGVARRADTDQWVIEWNDEELSTHYRVGIRRLGLGDFQVQVDPAQCNVLALPKTLTLSRTSPGCKLEDDREAALQQFWNQLRDSLARRDAAALQGLAMPRPLFAEGPDNEAGSSELLAQGMHCLSELALPRTPRQTLGQLLQQATPSMASAPWVRRDGRDRIGLAGVMELRWLARRGWRIDWINASRRVLSGCQKAR